MATSSKIHGRNGFFNLDDSTGACQNLSGDGNKTDLVVTFKNHETTSYGDPAIQRIAGSAFQDCKLTFDAWANQSANQNLAVLAGLIGGSTMFRWGPAGSGTGQVKYSACVLLDDFSIGAPVDGIITVKGSMSLASGSLTKGTW